MQNRQLIAHYSGIHSSKSFGATAVGSKVWTYAWDRSIHVWSAQVRATHVAHKLKHKET